MREAIGLGRLFGVGGRGGERGYILVGLAMTAVCQFFAIILAIKLLKLQT